MLNMNSPTVQAMLNNTPQGFGNIPMYYGSAPVVTQTVQPVQQDNQIPFPSPKEMLTNAGQSMVYQPTQFVPQNNIVGGYNPNIQNIFKDYSNPYMGYGSYGGFPSYMNRSYFMGPPDEESRQTLEAAINNGLTYDEQLIQESNLYKSISRIVSKNLGRSEEEAKECEESFNIYNKYPTEGPLERKPIEPLKVRLRDGENVYENNPEKIKERIKFNDYIRNVSYAQQMSIRQNMTEYAAVNRANQMYMRAPERMFDQMDLLDFFNNGAGVLIADSLNRELYQQSINQTSQLYNKSEFKKKLFENNGIQSKEQLSAVERYAGRYGVMPNGTPVSPGRDPAIAESFSYDPKTGQYSVTAPNFIRDRLEAARQSFIKSIDG